MICTGMLANIVDWVMHPVHVAFFFMLHHKYHADNLHGGRDIQQHWFVVVWHDKDWVASEQPLDVIKGLLGFVGPHKTICLLEEPV